MSITIVEERPDSPDAVRLIAELDATLAPEYPPESRHGYPVDKLLRERVTFFVARQDGTPVGCCGVLLVAGQYAELKRMYVRPDFRGSGIGRLLLERVAEYSRNAGQTLLRLETGIYQKAAIVLYEREGFRRIPPFGPYWDDPVSLCYEKKL